MATSSLGVVSGIEGRIAVGGQAINLEYWEAELFVNAGESTNFESVLISGAAGANTILAKESYTGTGYVRWSIRGKWDANANQWGSPPNLVEGILTPASPGMQFLARKTGSRGFVFPSVLILRTKMTVNAQRDAATYEASGENQGSWTRIV